MKLKSFSTIAMIILTTFLISNCSIGQVEEEIREIIIGSGSNTSTGSTSFHQFRGKWNFSVLGKQEKLTCYLSPSGDSLTGGCSIGYFGEEVGRLSIFPRGSSISINLISNKTNRLIAAGPLYLQQEDIFSGNCSFLHQNGRKEYRDCFLMRD